MNVITYSKEHNIDKAIVMELTDKNHHMSGLSEDDLIILDNYVAQLAIEVVGVNEVEVDTIKEPESIEVDRSLTPVDTSVKPPWVNEIQWLMHGTRCWDMQK